MEETEKPQSAVCYRCGNFTRYYTKGHMRFTLTKCGYCCKRKEIVQSDGNCEHWRKSHGRAYVCRKSSLTALSDLLANLSGVKQILQEAEEEINRESKSGV